jgi:hypothetical protein
MIGSASERAQEVKRIFTATFAWLAFLAFVAVGIAYLAPKALAFLARKDELRNDTMGATGSMSVGYWVALVVASIVLLLIVAALLPQLNQALFNYSNNEPVFGPIMKTIVPILIGAGILLFFVSVYLATVRSRGH